MTIKTYNIRVLAPNRRLDDGNATVQISTDAGLLRRALGDITGKFTDVHGIAPTHLILFNNNGIKDNSSSKVCSPSMKSVILHLYIGLHFPVCASN